MNNQGMGLGAQSPQKFADFRGVVDITIKRAMGALRKYPQWRRPYQWVDLTSGPGLDEMPGGGYLDGTPPIAMDKLCEVQHSLGVSFEAAFFEHNHDRFLQLEHVLLDRYGPQHPTGDYEVIEGDSRLYLPKIADSHHLVGELGAFVYDPTEQVDLDFLAEIARNANRYRYDLIVYVSGSSIKRPRGLPARYKTDRRTLVQRLQEIPKVKWIVRKPSGPSEWSWFIGTNDPKFPVWTQRGFYDITSPEGAAVIDQMNLTEAERLLRDHGGGLL